MRPAFDSGNLNDPRLGPISRPGSKLRPATGMSILRITLKAPAKIAARSHGPALQVEIAPTPRPPITISFARNQDDPRRASLTTLLPAADEVLALTDPSPAIF